MMKSLLRRALIAAVLLALPATYLQGHAAVSPPGLSVSGTQIMAGGVPIRLRGVSMGDPFWARNPDWYSLLTLSDYATLAQQWHANVVRISVFPTQWKNMDHTQLLAGLDQQVSAALDNGLYVIISYHVIGWPDGYYQPAYPGNPADTYDSSMALATSFWDQMSRTYGSDTRIVFDLWNEPVNEADLTTFPSDPNPLWPILKGYYETLIQTVRGNNAQNILLATGNRWASWLAGIKDDPLSDPNVVYAYHKYSVPGQNTADVWNMDTGGLIGVKPVIVSEWGYEDTDAGPNPQWPGTVADYGIPFTTWLEDNQLSNLSWIYHYDWTPSMLKSDGSLTLYGEFARNYIASHNASQVAVKFLSAAGQDGWVLESAETSGVGGSLNNTAGTLRLGDDASNRQYRSILSFNTAGLPDNAVITSATLQIRQAGLVGANPFNTLGNILADVRKGGFSGDRALQAGDFQAAAGKNAVMLFKNDAVDGWYSAALGTKSLGFINKTGPTQFRLRFSRGDNNNFAANYLKLYSGNYAADPSSRPVLVIEYFVP